MKTVAILAALTLASISVPAETPEELLQPREISFKCDEKTKVCTLEQGDLEFLMKQNILLSNIAIVMWDKIQSCRGGRSI